MKFDTKFGNYIKCSNNTSKILKKILLIVAIIYFLTFIIYITENKVIFLFNTSIICIVNLLLELFYRKMIRTNTSILHILGNSYVLIYSFLISLLTPINIPLSVLIIIKIFSYILLKIIDKFLKIKINYICFVLFLSILYLNINNININTCSYLTMNVFLMLMMIIIIAFLTINDCLKWRIAISYFITLLVITSVYSLFFNINFLTSINFIFSFYNMIIGTFVIVDMKTTSVIPFSQIIYGIFLAIFMFISIEFLNYYRFYIFVLIFNVVNTIIDNICIYVKNKNSVLI